MLVRDRGPPAIQGDALPQPGVASYLRLKANLPATTRMSG